MISFHGMENTGQYRFTTDGIFDCKYLCVMMLLILFSIIFILGRPQSLPRHHGRLLPPRLMCGYAHTRAAYRHLLSLKFPAIIAITLSKCLSWARPRAGDILLSARRDGHYALHHNSFSPLPLPKAYV